MHTQYTKLHNAIELCNPKIGKVLSVIGCVRCQLVIEGAYKNVCGSNTPPPPLKSY